MKIVVNRCFGGFSLSQAAYERLIELGVPLKKYAEPERNPETGLYEEEQDDGECIYLSEDRMSFLGRYWDTWTRDSRTHPLIIQVVEELGEKADGPCAALEIVDVPDGVDWQIEEYDGKEWVAERHRTW